MDNRRLLPIMALVVSALIFIGALVFALRPASPQRATAPTIARTSVPGTIVAVGQSGVATLTPEPSAEPTAAPTVTPTSSPAPSARPSTAVGAATRVGPTAVVPVGVGPTPTPAPPPPAVAPPSPPPASAPSAPPVAAAPPTPTPAPPPPAPAIAPTTPPRPAPQPPPTATQPPIAAPPPVTSGPPPTNVGTPVRVLIPSIGVDATIEQVGIDAEGNMATPEDPWNTAWYAPGARPGQRGNAAIAGHVDYAGIGPVVFWDLSTLAVGAEVLVVTDSGQTLRFTVRGGEYYRPANAPLQEIFGATNSVNLNLITCGGTFDPATRQYDQRYVVFTTYAGQ